MTKKDYLMLAAALRTARERIAPAMHSAQRLEGARIAAQCIADAIAREAPAFDPALFMRNAGFSP